MMPRQSPDQIGRDNVYSGSQLPQRKQHEPDHHGQQRQQGAGFSSKQMLDAYIYDFFSKSSLKNSAATFCRETGMVDANGVAKSPSVIDEVKDAPQGFLYEWWQIFWDLFNARTHKEGSAVAKEYTNILADRQKEDYAYRSHAVQAARLQRMAGQNREVKREVDPSFSPFISPAMQYSPNANAPLHNMSSELHFDPRELKPTAHTPQYAPPAMGSDASGWPGYSNQTTQFTNNTIHNGPGDYYYPANPIPCSSPQPAACKTKPSRPQPTMKNSFTDVPTSPGRTPPAGSHKNSANSFAGRISVIEGLHNYQRQMIMSEIEYNNQNKKATPSPGTSGGTASKKNMLPPSAGISPRSSTPTSASCSNLNVMNASKPKTIRRRSANSTLGPVSRSMQSSYSDDPSTPINPPHSTNPNDPNERLVLANSLATVSEAGPPSGGEVTDSSKKSTKKVRKPKKALAITFSNNGFSFVPPSSVPTPPNEVQQKAQFRVLNKNHAKKAQGSRSNNKLSKGSADASPQVLCDESSMTTPTFVNTLWNGNNRTQTTPHANFTFVGESGDGSAATSGPTNVDSAVGSSSGGSYHYNEPDADDLLNINSMLSMSDVTAIKGEIPPNGVIPGTESASSLHDANHQDFNLDLLDHGEPSFNFLSPRQ